MAASKELLASYDDAIAVMSRVCRFVEWKIYGGGEDVKNWSPFGPSRDRKSAWKEIEGEKWIYVFRSYARVASAGVWVEELHLDKQGNISATPMEKAKSDKTGKPLERDKRPQPVAFGKTMSFARRVHGVAMEYYFFASRIRLPASTIEAIGANISAYAPPINFEEDDANIVGIEGGALLVPVLDPVTVALHLHANYVAAANDLIDYSAQHKDQSDKKRKQVGLRQKKHLLALLIKALVDPKVDVNNELVNRLRRQGIDLEKFLEEYDRQIHYRLKWRDRWAGLLKTWLASDVMKVVAKAYESDAAEDFPKFFIPFCLCLTRTSESPAGRELLDELYAQPDHWMHKYLLPESQPTQDQFQVIRKGGGAVFEALKEYGARVVLEPAKYGKIQFVQTFNWLAGEKVVAPHNAAIKLGDDVVDHFIQVRTRNIVQVTELQVVVKEATIAPKWEGAATKFAIIVEFINTAIAVKALVDAMGGNSAAEKMLAVINLLGSGADIGVAILSIATKARVWIGVLGFVSGVIDTALAIVAAIEAYKKDDMGGMVGSGVIAVGSSLAAAASLGLLAGASWTGPVAIAALALVALGYAIKLMFGDNDTAYHKLVTHCEWGEKAGQGSDQPDWAPAAYKDWKGNYDLQLRAAVNVLCGFSLQHNKDFAEQPLKDQREIRLNVNWIPTGATLTVTYHEEWEAAADSRVLTDSFVFKQSGPISTGGFLSITPRNQTSYVVRAQKKTNEKGIENGIYPGFADGFKKIWIEAQLSMDFESVQFLIPENKKYKATIVSA
jgi:hypothetical protein